MQFSQDGTHVININDPNDRDLVYVAWLLPENPASQNTILMQNALNEARDSGGGVVAVMTPGEYDFSGTLIIYDNTTFKIDKGVVLNRKNVGGSNSATKVMRNSNWDSTVFTVTGNLSGTVMGGGRLAWIYTITGTATGHDFAVGDYVLVKGDTSNLYNGVHKITAVTANTFSFEIIYYGTLPASTGTITAALANANITIDVNGWINGNIDQGVDAASDGLDSMCFIFNKVKNLTVLDFNGGGFNKYIFHMANIYDFDCGKAYIVNPSDGFHFNSPASNVNIANVGGQTGDDLIAFTQDNYGYTQYTLPDDTGAFESINIRDIQTAYAFGNLIALYPAGNKGAFRNVSLSKIGCVLGGGSPITISSPSNNPGVVEDLTIDELSFTQQENGVNPLIVIYNGAGINTLDISNIKPNLSPRPASIYTTGTATKGSNSITSPGTTTGLVEGMLVSGPGIMAGSYITAIGAAITISEKAMVSGTGIALEFIPVASSKGALIGFGEGGGNINSLDMSNIDFTLDCRSSGHNRSMISLKTANTCSINSLKLNNITSKSYGRSASYSIIAAAGVNTFVRDVVANNLVIHGYGNFTDGSHSGLGSDFVTNYVFNNVSLNNAQFLVGDVANATFTCSKISAIGTLDGPIFNLYGTSKTYNLNIQQTNNNNSSGQALLGYGTTNTFNILGGDGTFILKSDTAGATFNFTKGAIYWDTQVSAPGLYARGDSSSTRIAT